LSEHGTTLRVGRRAIALSHPDRVYFPGRPSITKRELAEYYAAVAPAMVPYTRNRPAMLHRFPEGIAGQGFYQKEISDWFPDWIARATVPKSGGEVTHVLCNDAATLVYLAGQGCITPHVWLSRIDKPQHPDRLIFDLDPPRGFAQAREGARLVRELLDELGLASVIMTTGGRGLHVIVPLDRAADFDAVRAFARLAATLLARRHPKTLTVEARIPKRRGRLFLDTTRNAYAQTGVAPYAARPHAGAPVATPLGWDELGDRGLDSQSYTVRNVLRRLDRTDPWREGARRRQGLRAAGRQLDELARSD
jgi:bifunctional non-homologous end joining protein LigD